MQYYERMDWIVELLDDRVREEFDTLPLDMKARFRRIVELIQGHGLERVREPHVLHLEGALWEMRMKGKDGEGPPRGCFAGLHQENSENTQAGD